MVVRTSNEPNLIADSGNTFTTFNPFPIPIVRILNTRERFRY